MKQIRTVLKLKWSSVGSSKELKLHPEEDFRCIKDALMKLIYYFLSNYSGDYEQ